MESMPGHNAGAVAGVLRRRFQLPDAEAHVVRRRLADLMVYERRMVGELQSLLHCNPKQSSQLTVLSEVD